MKPFDLYYKCFWCARIFVGAKELFCSIELAFLRQKFDMLNRLEWCNAKFEISGTNSVWNTGGGMFFYQFLIDWKTINVETMAALRRYFKCKNKKNACQQSFQKWAKPKSSHIRFGEQYFALKMEAIVSTHVPASIAMQQVQNYVMKERKKKNCFHFTTFYEALVLLLIRKKYHKNGINNDFVVIFSSLSSCLSCFWCESEVAAHSHWQCGSMVQLSWWLYVIVRE